jgi:hypothetical protein
MDYLLAQFLFSVEIVFMKIAANEGNFLHFFHVFILMGKKSASFRKTKINEKAQTSTKQIYPFYRYLLQNSLPNYRKELKSTI